MEWPYIITIVAVLLCLIALTITVLLQAKVTWRQTQQLQQAYGDVDAQANGAGIHASGGKVRETIGK